jgi:phage baseplate assembly protein V
MNYNNTQHDRLLANLIKYGRIESVDPDEGIATVDFDGELVPGLTWSKPSAGKTRKWWVPSKDEQVCVLSPSGDLAQGTIAFSMEQDEFPNAGNSADYERTIYDDGTVIEYNTASNTLMIDASASSGTVIIKCNTATVEAETSVTIDTPNTTCTGNLTVAKSLSVGTAGGTSTMKGNMSVEGTVTATVDVLGGGKSLIGHTNGGEPVD